MENPKNQSFGFEDRREVVAQAGRIAELLQETGSWEQLSRIVEAYPEVLCEKRVQSAVEGRFCDSAISVREAALELVGRHIASHPDVGLKYFQKVAERVKDTGVSVRERAIMIIRDMCTSSARFLEFTSACIEIISRVSDEESSIQDLVCKTFYEFWFEEPTVVPTQFVGDGSSVPLEVAKKTEQIVEMLKRMPNHQPLVTVIKRNLSLDFLPQSAKAVGISPVVLASVRKRCELMCKFLLERILQVPGNKEEEVHTLPYVLLLQAFCVVDPTLCAPASDPSQFIVTLQPYLKNQKDNKEIAQFLESILFVIDVLLPLLLKLPPSFVKELEQDLKVMIDRHSSVNVLRACIKCLCSLIKVAGKDAAVVERLIQLFVRRLQCLELEKKPFLVHSLCCLGLLILYGRELLMSNSGNVHLDKSLEMLKKHLKSKDMTIRLWSLQSLGFVLIARPNYMLQMEVGKILEATLSPGCNNQLKNQSLENMFKYLLDAESEMAKEKVDNNAIDSVEGTGDTNICIDIVHLYWQKILGRCLDKNQQVRQWALKIIGVVLRQDLVHPMNCVPYLIALETDSQEVNSKLAHHLLMNVNEKYPSSLESRLGDGLQLSFGFIQAMNAGSTEKATQDTSPGIVKGKSDGSSFSHARLGVSRIYKLIRGNRDSRNTILFSIVYKFDAGYSRPTSIPFLRYCTEILASLPFVSPDEPLYLIYAINRIIQLRVGGIESNMKHLSLMNQDATLECKNSADSHGISKDVVKFFKTDCHAVIALPLLLKLKRHLQIVYSLNDARCQAYSPNDPPEPGVDLSEPNIPFNLSETCTSLPSSYKEFAERYQGFKAALKEDIAFAQKF